MKASIIVGLALLALGVQTSFALAETPAKKPSGPIETVLYQGDESACRAARIGSGRVFGDVVPVVGDKKDELEWTEIIRKDYEADPGRADASYRAYIAQADADTFYILQETSGAFETLGSRVGVMWRAKEPAGEMAAMARERILGLGLRDLRWLLLSMPVFPDLASGLMLEIPGGPYVALHMSDAPARAAVLKELRADKHWQTSLRLQDDDLSLILLGPADTLWTAAKVNGTTYQIATLRETPGTEERVSIAFSRNTVRCVVQTRHAS